MTVSANIDNYILNAIAQLDSNIVNVDDLADLLCNKMSNEGISVYPSLKEEIIDLLYKYRFKEICANDFVNSFKETLSISEMYVDDVDNANDTLNTQSNESNQNNVVNNNQTSDTNNNISNNRSYEEVAKSIVTPSIGYINDKSKGAPPKEVTIDVDTDIILGTTEELANIESTVESTNITVPADVGKYTEGIEELVKGAKEEITESLETTKEAMNQVTDLVTSVDENISLVIFDKLGFTDLNKLAYNYRQNSRVMEVQQEFFINGGCTIEGDFAIKTINNKECKYNMKTHKFYIDGHILFESYFYIPSNATSYDNLNTYTFFAEYGEGSKDHINDQATNSVVAKIMKYKSDKKFDKYDETATLTKFVNSVAGTKLNEGCYNIIGGDSVYGTHSLRITAQNPDVYQKVYCVNNAAIVDGVNGCKAAKTKFASLEELKGLNGKEIFFISATGDDNITHGMEGNSGWVNKGTKYEEGYLYTGLNLLCENCPDARVHMIYNDTNVSGNQEKIVTILKDLESKYNNYSYDSEYWREFAQNDYQYHGDGKYIVSELVNAGATNYNDV